MRSRVDRLYQSGAAVVGALLACLDDAGRLARRKGHRDLPIGGDHDGKKLEPRRSDAQRSSAHPIRAVRNGAAPDLPSTSALSFEHRGCARSLAAAAHCRSAVPGRHNHPDPRRGETASSAVWRRARAICPRRSGAYSVDVLSSIARRRRRPCPSLRRRARAPCGPPRHPCRCGPRRRHPSTGGRTSYRAICPRGWTLGRARPSFARLP